MQTYLNSVAKRAREAAGYSQVYRPGEGWTTMEAHGRFVPLKVVQQGEFPDSAAAPRPDVRAVDPDTGDTVAIFRSRR